MVVSCGWIEELRNCGSGFVESSPVEVTQNDSLICFFASGLYQAHLRIVIFPPVAVVNEVIDPGPQLGVERCAKIGLPPKVKRQIGIQMGKDNARQQGGAGSAETERQLFRTNLSASSSADM